MIQIQIAAVHPKMGSPELPWPARKSAQAARWDCVAAIDEPLELWPGRLVKVPLGFALALPEGWEAQVQTLSGLASQGIIMPNGPGTVDADFRGEVSALLYYLRQYTSEEFYGAPYLALAPTNELVIKTGDRICQLLIAPVPDVTWKHVARGEMSKTERGEGGFGSTDKKPFMKLTGPMLEDFTK